MEQVGYKVSYINALTLFHFSKKSGTDVEQVEQKKKASAMGAFSPLFLDEMLCGFFVYSIEL